MVAEILQSSKLMRRDLLRNMINKDSVLKMNLSIFINVLVINIYDQNTDTLV